MFLWKDQWNLFERERQDKLIISEIKEELKLLIHGHQNENKEILRTTLCPQFW